MGIFLQYIELATGMTGLFIGLIKVLLCVHLITKTEGKLKRFISYIAIAGCFRIVFMLWEILGFGRLAEYGTLMSFIFAVIEGFLILIGLFKFNEVINDIICSNTGAAPQNKFNREKVAKENRRKENPVKRGIVRNIANKYLDLTGRNPRFKN